MSEDFQFYKEQLLVKVYDSKEMMGKAAALEVAEKIKSLLENRDRINMAFAAAPSQNEFLEELIKIKGIDWNRVIAFHLDEYLDLEQNSPQKFASFLNEAIFNQVNFKEVYYIDVPGLDTRGKISRYANLLKENPIDIACIGIGENGHIAFNDPHVADFTDPESFKKVDLDQKCRMQQVNDGCFSDLSAVPTYALTMTIPSILSFDFIFCIVPAIEKSQAVYDTINGQIEVACPASVLRCHQRSTLYLDKDAAKMIRMS